MSDNTAVARDPLFGEVALNWKWMLGLGILMAILGVVGLGLVYQLTIIATIYLGVMVVIGGVAQLVNAFQCAGWTAVLGHVAVGLVYLVAGVVLIALPVQSAWWLTLLLGVFFIITGVLRVMMAFQIRSAGSAWIWLVLTGIVSVALGAMIFGIVDFPDAETVASVAGAQGWFREWGWVIGLFVALELIVHGAALVAIALAARKGGQTTTGTGTDAGSADATA